MSISRINAALFSILFAINFCFANPLTSGNIAFEKGNFKEAYELYSSVLNENGGSFELYHNLGTAAAKLGKLDEARLNLERALIIHPGNKDTRKNIKWIKTELSESIAPLPEFLPKVYWDATSAVLNSATWYYFSFFLMLLAAFVLWKWLFNREIKLNGKVHLALFVLTFSLSLLFALLGSSRSHQISNKENGVVMNLNKELLQEPESGAEIIQELSVGSKIKIEVELGVWLKVIAEDGAKGWITNKGLSIIEL